MILLGMKNWEEDDVITDYISNPVLNLSLIHILAMAVYMLGFNTYMGFGDKIRGELGEDKDGDVYKRQRWKS